MAHVWDVKHAKVLLCRLTRESLSSKVHANMHKQDTQQDSQATHSVPYANHFRGKELTDSPCLQAAQAAKQEEVYCVIKRLDTVNR